MRARLVQALGLIGLGCLLAAPATAQTVVKVGVILTYSGPEASLGETIDRGIKLWMKEHGDSLPGIKVELIRRDDTGPKAEVAKQLATELVVRDKINLLTGVVWSPTFLTSRIYSFCTMSRVSGSIMIGPRGLSCFQPLSSDIVLSGSILPFCALITSKIAAIPSQPPSDRKSG